MGMGKKKNQFGNTFEKLAKTHKILSNFGQKPWYLEK